MSAKKEKDLDIRQKVVEATLFLAAERGWSQTSLSDIAEHAGISMGDLYDIIDDKNDVLALLGRIIDKKVIQSTKVEVDVSASPRDRLFDLMMDRYDALNEHREGVVAILESFKFDPKQMVISFPHICRSMTWMLELCKLETNGIKGAIKVAGLAGVYLTVLKTWMEDETPDLSKTMAALDKTLQRAETAATTFGF